MDLVSYASPLLDLCSMQWDCTTDKVSRSGTILEGYRAFNLTIINIDIFYNSNSFYIPCHLVNVNTK